MSYQPTAVEVKQLRGNTGLGLMFCKKALIQADGDQNAAIKWLRETGELARADQSAGRPTAAGRIVAYTHPGGQLAAMVAISCETDFVAQNAEFIGFCKDIAMHVAAAQPLCVNMAQLEGTAAYTAELDIVDFQVKQMNKPEKIAVNIANGKMKKFAQEVCLLEQGWVKDGDIPIKTMLANIIAKTGENITINAFQVMAVR